MTKKLLLVSLWFPLTCLLLFINLRLLSGYSNSSAHHKLSALAPAEQGFQLAASTGTSQVLSASVVAADARVYLVESFLTKHNSPMAPFSGTIINESDLNKLDFRLIPAIAMCESNAGKHMPKKDEFNAFGIAVYTGQNHGKAFDSWPHSISWVAKYLRTRYYEKGLTDLRSIGAVWAPPSVANGYSWTSCVESFMAEII